MKNIILKYKYFNVQYINPIFYRGIENMCECTCVCVYVGAIVSSYPLTESYIYCKNLFFIKVERQNDRRCKVTSRRVPSLYRFPHASKCMSGLLHPEEG